MLAAFVSQYYAEQPAPGEIVLDRDIDDRELLQKRVVAAAAGKRVQLKCSVRGDRAGYLDLARRNAELALATELGSHAAQQRACWSRCATCSAWRNCRSASNASTSATRWARRRSRRASCSMPKARCAAQYRRYNIAGIEPGDDYAAMHQALERRFRRAVEESGVLPDVLLIDGGTGQVAQAHAVLADLGIDGVALVGVAKGEARRAGHETLLLPRRPRRCGPGRNRPACN